MKTTRLSTLIAEDQRVLRGLDQLQSTMPDVLLGGVKYTPEGLAAFLRARIAAAIAVGSTKAHWLHAIETHNALDKQRDVLLRELRVVVMAMFGPDSPQASALGFRPAKKRTPLTPAQKVARAAKSLATRKARGTLGSRQRVALTLTSEP